jgi:hypothetical protein
MKARRRDNILKPAPRKPFRSQPRRHDPMLVLNLALFNFTDGWSRTFSKQEYTRSYA